MKIKQQHSIKRKINHQWSLSQIKQYLDSLHLRTAFFDCNLTIKMITILLIVN
jgi:hypothetical protein